MSSGESVVTDVQSGTRERPFEFSPAIASFRPPSRHLEVAEI
jgi:hypothetical protein